MIKHKDSHLDHDINEAQISHVIKLFADRDSFFIDRLVFGVF